MTVIDHGLSGGLAAFALQPFFSKYVSKPKAVFIMFLAATWPDIDYIARLFGPRFYYNTVNNLFLSHRGFTHTIAGILLFGLIAALLSLAYTGIPKIKAKRLYARPFVIFALAFLGGALHLFEDYLGPNGPWKGIPYFYPLSEARIPGISLYGWYDFVTIYLSIAAFAAATAISILGSFFKKYVRWFDALTIAVVLGVFITAGLHLSRSPGYHETLGFKKAEQEWKTYQLSILPPKVKNFSDEAQETGMKTLFSLLPNLKPVYYGILAALLFGGPLVWLFLRMTFYLLFRIFGKRLPIRHPIRAFAVTVLFFIGLPVGLFALYFWSNMPMSIDGRDVPRASGFDFPVGDANGKGFNGVDDKGWYVGQSFLNPYYHPGEDWNGKGGGNTDFGQPVYSMAEGTVVFAENCIHWGNMVLIAHRLPSGELVFSLSAHLKDVMVREGETVQRRRQIGTVGRGYRDMSYTAAHLHLEIRKENMARCPVVFWPAITAVQSPGNGKKHVMRYIEDHYYDPSRFITKRRTLDKTAAVQQKGPSRPTAPMARLPLKNSQKIEK